jgi:hypothetical protein
MNSDNEMSPRETAGISRRRVMTGVGAAVAGGLVVGVGVAAPAGASDSGAQVAAGPAGTTVFEMVCRITQAGDSFDGHGYLTAIAGLDSSTLFSDPDSRDEAHALFVATANGELVGRSVDGVVHALDIDGELAIYYSGTAGAAWSDPASFAHGDQVAKYSLNLQDVLTVILPLPLPPTGVPTLYGESQQTKAASVRGRRFGKKGQALRFNATGIGTRSDTGPIDAAVATLTIAGSMIAA